MVNKMALETAHKNRQSALISESMYLESSQFFSYFVSWIVKDWARTKQSAGFMSILELLCLWHASPLFQSKEDLIPPYNRMLTKRLLVHFLLPPLHLLIVNLPISFILCLHESYVGIFDDGPSRPVASWHLLQSWTDHILFVIGLSVSLIGCLKAFPGADQMAVMVAWRTRGPAAHSDC